MSSKGPRDTFSDKDLEQEVALARRSASSSSAPADLFVDEPSVVGTMDQQMAWQAIGRVEKWANNMAKAMNAQGQMVSRIPRIEEQTREAGKVAEDSFQETRGINIKLDSMDGRVERLAKRVDEGHACLFGDAVPRLQEKVDQDVYHGGRIKERVGAAEEAIKEHKKERSEDKKEARAAKRTSMWSLIGIVVTLLVVVGGGVYAYGHFHGTMTARESAVDRSIEGLQGDVEKIRVDVDTIAKTIGDTPMKEAVKEAVQGAMARERTTGYDGLCDGMNDREKRRIRSVLKSPIPPSCRE